MNSTTIKRFSAKWLNPTSTEILDCDTNLKIIVCNHSSRKVELILSLLNLYYEKFDRFVPDFVTDYCLEQNGYRMLSKLGYSNLEKNANILNFNSLEKKLNKYSKIRRLEESVDEYLGGW